MIKTTILLFLLAVAGSACKSQEKKKSESTEVQTANSDPLVPLWLEKQLPKWRADGYTTVSAYQWKQDTVYLAIPPCCDRFSELYNRKGELICHPGGGITGKGDGKCPEFRVDATLLREFKSDYK